jgi:hypothetical protein
MGNIRSPNSIAIAVLEQRRETNRFEIIARLNEKDRRLHPSVYMLLAVEYGAKKDK